MTSIRILFDENAPRAVDRGLRRRLSRADIFRAGEPSAPPKGTADAALLVWCGETGRVLVSLDRRTIPLAFGDHLTAGRCSAGVFLIGRDAPLPRILDDLVLLIGATEAEEWIDRLVFLPLAGI